MAKVGTGAAGSQLKRVGNYIAPQVNKDTNRVAAKNSQERAIKATKENQEDAQLEKRLEGDSVDPDEFLVTATGIGDEDDFNRIAATAAVDRAKELFTQASDFDTSGDRISADSRRADAAKIQASLKNFTNNTAATTKIFKSYEKDFTEGKILQGAYDKMAIGGTIRGEAVPRLDKNLNWEVEVLMRDAETGEPILGEDGKAKTVVHNLGDVKKGLAKPYYFNEERGADGELNKILVSLGKSKIDKLNGGYIDTNQVWDEKRQNSLNNFIEGTLSNDREMYKWHEYITGEEKFEGFTDAEKSKIRQRIQTGVEGAYDTEQSTKVAPRTAAQIKAAADARAQDAKDLANLKEENKTGKLKYSTGSTRTSEGKKAMTFSTKDGFDLSTVSFDKFDTGTVLKSTYNVALVDEDGKIFLSNGKDEIDLNETQQVYIANSLGLASTEEMLKVAGVKDTKEKSKGKVR
jgi:hypothetical protein